MITTILFDVDGVLVDSFEANLKYFQDLFSYTGYKIPTREEYKNLFHKPMHEVIRIITQGSDEEVEKIYNIGMGPSIEYNINLMSIPEELDTVLKSLNQNYLLGVVTSRVRESVFEGPRNNLSHVKNYFKVAVAYEDTENHKPLPDPLLFAAQVLCVNPENCVYIGDTESDMAAAKAAGMKFIHYTNTPSPEADAHTYSFRELSNIINLLSD